MKRLCLLAVGIGVAAFLGCGSPALAGWHRNEWNGWVLRDRDMDGFEGRSVGINRFGPAGQTPFNPAGSTPVNPAGSSPVNPAGSTPVPRF
jgi:hypothetical protein